MSSSYGILDNSKIYGRREETNNETNNEETEETNNEETPFNLFIRELTKTIRDLINGDFKKREDNSKNTYLGIIIIIFSFIFILLTY